MTSSGVPIVRLVIRHGGQWVDGIYKGVHPKSYHRLIIKDDEDVALILLEQRNVSVVYVSIKGHQTNVMSHEEVGQHGCASNQFLASLEQMQRSGETVECVMPLSNENTIVEDNNMRLEGDTATLEDNTAFDEGNEDLFAAGEDRFNDTLDDGLEQSQDDSSDDDCLYDSDIPTCNNVEGKTEPVRSVDVGDVQCDDPIYNNPIVGISHTWVNASAEKFSFQTITTEESTCAEDRLYKGRMFLSKGELKRALNMLVIKEKFAIRVKRSCKAHYEVGCKDKACKFSVRATKLLDRGVYWKVRTFHKVHTCTVDGLQGQFPTTSAKMIGELMSHKLRANGVALRPKEYVERLIFGPPEESFQLLSSYFYMLEQKNPGTVTAVATDEEERFKYYFWSYRACIQGFRDVMRPTIAIDATHLKGRFKRVLFVAICKDENECVYPVAFGISHVQDEDSWTWFLSKLRDAVGCPENTMFISDQHLAVKVTTPLNPWVARQLSKRFNDAHRFLVKPINRVEFEVKDGKMDGLVNLSRKTCSCCEFQTDLLPCSHAIVVISKCNHEAIEFCADYYKTTVLVEGYSGSIRPAKLEDLGGKGFHQLVKAVEHGDVRNARDTGITDRTAHPHLQFHPQIRHHLQVNRCLHNCADPKHVQVADKSVTHVTTIQYEGQCLKIYGVLWMKTTCLPN
ncbi:Uncharacterized protein TCM_017607 [Theobroma cacao]|uniref:SWIM-type domain-containing protein n=1 Tax=Theobroma cacao TaxID=3641 RepID=A0A061EDX4_THECC|nr:Uncharacterized protein TCM_017607 [Theobroma cacao]